ncbi:MAG TPA: hypothetical protein VHW03_08080, partial [Chthoniobacterales bacterium]|nr:hypothetical protein [Chthoniobacterales bacterium]
RPRQLKRATQVDWPSLISVMRGAAERSEPPFAAAVELTRSLFSVQKVPLGVEHPLATGPKPCGLLVEAERARFVRRGIVEILNSRDNWEPRGETVEASLGEIFIREGEHWTPALRQPQMLDRFSGGNLCRLREKGIYGREMPLATSAPDEPQVQLVKPLRKILQVRSLPENELLAKIAVLLPDWTGGGALAGVVRRGKQIAAQIDFSGVKARAVRDSLGNALLDPPERAAIPLACRGCSELEHDQTVEIVASPAYAWRRLGLVEPDGTPTRRGIVFGFFQAGEGLAIAAGLEDETYPIEDLIFDLANLRAGPRFSGEDLPLGGRLGALCQTVFERVDHPGYLEMGVPVHYGAGASEVVREIFANPGGRYKLTSDSLRHGDVERALMEWRSLLRHTAAAPDLEWNRWMALKKTAAGLLERTTSPTTLDFPPLLAAQQRRFA